MVCFFGEIMPKYFIYLVWFVLRHSVLSDVTVASC